MGRDDRRTSGHRIDFVGATLLAVSTSLPELSTSITAVKVGAGGMAISYIFGSDAVDTTLLFVADVAYLVSTIGRLGVFLAGVAIVVTVIYRIGLNERYDKSFFRAGFISAA